MYFVLWPLVEEDNELSHQCVLVLLLAEKLELLVNFSVLYVDLVNQHRYEFLKESDAELDSI